MPPLAYGLVPLRAVRSQALRFSCRSSLETPLSLEMNANSHGRIDGFEGSDEEYVRFLEG